MRNILIIVFAAGSIVTMAGQTTTNTNADNKTKAAKKVTKEPPPVTIPADAVPVGDGSFRYTDKAGKNWIYRNTPWGVQKAEEKVTVKPVETVAVDPTKTEDLGDSVRFTKPTPFGPKVWTTKKSALDSYEQSIWNRDKEKNQKPSTDAKPDGSESGKAESSKSDSKTSSQTSNK
jgi:hypothetical protein